MTSKTIAIVFALAALSLSACNTVNGAGKDMKSAGQCRFEIVRQGWQEELAIDPLDYSGRDSAAEYSGHRKCLKGARHFQALRCTTSPGKPVGPR